MRPRVAPALPGSRGSAILPRRERRDGDGHDIDAVQELLGHRDIRTMMIDTHVLNRGRRPTEVRRTGCSPPDPLAASSARCAKIRCRATPRILARQHPVHGAQDRESKGPEVSKETWRNVETGCVASQRLPSYADPRILWPNSG